jgi:hypothetical protein
MEDEQSFGDRRRFYVRMKHDLTLKPVAEAIPVEKTQPDKFCTDWGGTALQISAGSACLSFSKARSCYTI